MERKAGFCFGSSGKRMDQYMIKDHMLSHYRKLYSAKAAVDCSVPKSMCSNVRYTDQKRREQLRKDTPSQSARSISQTSTRINSRTSCSSKNSRPSIQGVDGACRYLEPSVISSPRVSTSFHSKQTVYPSQTACAYQSPANHFRTSSEFSYRIPDPQRQQSGYSSTAVSQRRYKSFQDPTQKTYSGDILMKHAHCFTQEKPFTPRTLKSDHKSTLLKYRYYTPPRRKTEEERSVSSRITRQDTYHGSAQFKRDFSPQLGSPHPFSVEHEWSDEESDLTAHHSKANRFRDNDFHLSLSRVSPEGMRSPIMRKVSAEEEELMYLEFITDVTNEILAQGLYSDRVLKRVFERHIHMNKHRLDEDKMRHLLDSLQNDLQSPTAASITTLGIEESDVSFQLRDEGPMLEKFSNTRHELASVNTDDADFILYKVFNEDRDQTENVTPAVASTPVNGSLLESFSPADLEEDKQELVNVELNHNQGSEITLNDHQHLTWPEENPRNTDDNNQLLEEINELGKSMAESLNVSEAQREQQEVFEDEQTREDLSDEEF